MTLPISGTLSLADVNIENGLSFNAPISLNDSLIRDMTGILSDTISQSSLYGKFSLSGYWAGGIKTGYLNCNEIDGIRFNNETSINPASSLPAETYDAIGVNSPTKGYVLGGNYWNGTSTYFNSSRIISFPFTTETASLLSSTLSEAGLVNSCGINSTVAGYLAGGAIGNAPISTFKKILFNNETTGTIGTAVLKSGRVAAAGCNSDTKGYVLGGLNNFALSEIEALIFANETINDTAASLPIEKYTRTGGGTNSATTGYVAGGINLFSTNIASIEGLTFSNESSFSTAASLSVACRPAGCNSKYKAYYASFLTSTTTTYYNAINAISFSTNTMSIPSATLAEARFQASTFQSGSL